MLSERLTENFTFKEMTCRHCFLIPAVVWPNVIFMCELLEKIRRDVKNPLLISRCYSCAQHNAEIGGDQHSRHIQGRAVDITSQSPNFTFRIVKSAIDHGVKKIKIYPGHVHLELSEKYDDSAWLLFGSYEKTKV